MVLGKLTCKELSDPSSEGREFIKTNLYLSITIKEYALDYSPM
jgi:hypothetical protein